AFRVEGVPSDKFAGASIKPVSPQGVSQVGGMDADLVRSAGLQPRLDQGGLFGGGENPVQGNRFRSVLGDTPAEGMGRVPTDGQADCARLPGETALHNGEVDPPDGPVFQLAVQQLV